MARKTAEEAQRTAQRILLEAHDAFSSTGFAAASVDDIARAAGVTRGAVYHHFTSKSGLLRALVADLQTAVAQRIEAAASHAVPAERLRAASHSFIDIVTDASTARVLLVEAPAALGWAQWRAMDADNSVRVLRAEIDAVGPHAPHQAEALTRLLSGALNDAALWLSEAGPQRGSEPADDATLAAAHRALDLVLDAIVPRTTRLRTLER